ncbi:mandelate racemase/muconate lactonizing enzyme family protein [Devosia ginsengisoli]|uniref:mandelate racemase/muconate lactonizing enzyme family protein n=1 Tax=Devosia ginsengisoli TaxID=400770 RepID=UPI0026E92904|nr:mandelate racemase/muconate lactonizing enzyme family protein [Devosia ginsengisoli]MCR6671873.1 mandelate racemase/muconate lactonizing enzyme family protein [Devosia ginsengisoli]
MKITAIETFQLEWQEPGQGVRSAFIRVQGEDGLFGLGEVSPMQGGLASLTVIANDMISDLVGHHVLDHAVLLDRLLHKCIKLGPEGVVTGAIAGLDIALWDLKGKLLGLPVYKLLGGAWQDRLPCYASMGGGAAKSAEWLVEHAVRRIKSERPAALKLRRDGDRTRQDLDIAGDIAKARAVREAVGDDFPLAFDANNGYSFGAAIRVGRALEELGYIWFEEPLQHYNVAATGELARRLDITVSAGEQTYTLQGVKDLIEAGVRMVQPDIIKMGGITGLMQCQAIAAAHGVELVPHQTQPSIGHMANVHMLSTIMLRSKPIELCDGWERADSVFRNPSRPVDGHFILPTAPGLGLEFDAAEMARRSIPVRAQ